jgi:hypothetical protein
LVEVRGFAKRAAMDPQIAVAPIIREYEIILGFDGLTTSGRSTGVSPAAWFQVNAMGKVRQIIRQYIDVFISVIQI